MTANIINGEQIARELRENLKEEVASLKKTNRFSPGLAIIVVKSPFSRVHVARLKERICRQLGINCNIHYLPETVTAEEIISLIQKLNDSREIHGINIHPLAPHFNHVFISQQVDPRKDIEGLHYLNIGRFLKGDPYMIPFVAGGIMKLIESTGQSLKGKRAVVIGRSKLVGKPVAFMLLHQKAAVSICHSQTPDPAEFTKRADILVSAAGKPHLVTEGMVKEGVIIIDVGISRVGTHLFGDVDFKNVEKVAGWITPVPGGVGPVTIAMLLDNLVRAAKVI